MIKRSTIIFFLLFSISSAAALVYENEPYDAQHVPVEVQAWWTPDFGHIHAAARLPIGQTVSGQLNFDVRIVLHNNPSHVYALAIHNEEGKTIAKPSLDLHCPYDGITELTCSWNVPISLDTRQIGEGWHTLRLRAQTHTPDGLLFTTSSDIPLNVQNGKRDRNSRKDIWCNGKSVQGKGYYEPEEDIGYAKAVIKCIPRGPISGIHRFRVMARAPADQLRVVLDGNHYIPAVGPWPVQDATVGTVLLETTQNVTSWKTIRLDTTLLQNGWHTLSVQARSPRTSTSTCDYCTGETNHLEGHVKLWIFVNN